MVWYQVRCYIGSLFRGQSGYSVIYIEAENKDDAKKKVESEYQNCLDVLCKVTSVTLLRDKFLIKQAEAHKAATIKCDEELKKLHEKGYLNIAVEWLDNTKYKIHYKTLEQKEKEDEALTEEMYKKALEEYNSLLKLVNDKN